MYNYAVYNYAVYIYLNVVFISPHEYARESRFTRQLVYITVSITAILYPTARTITIIKSMFENIWLQPNATYLRE